MVPLPAVAVRPCCQFHTDRTAAADRRLLANTLEEMGLTSQARRLSTAPETAAGKRQALASRRLAARAQPSKDLPARRTGLAAAQRSRGSAPRCTDLSIARVAPASGTRRVVP